MASKHTEAFATRLQPGETIAVSADGATASLPKGSARGACIVTNRRVALFRKGIFGGEALQAFPLASVTSVEHSRTFGWSKLLVRTASDLIDFRAGDKAVIEQLIAAIDHARL
jgi:hypothetical protein